MPSFFSSDIQDVVYKLLISLIISLVALPIHEYAHGYAAYRMGDNTAYRQGRLTLNPLVHIDPLGTLALVLFGFGWAKPVPINTSNFRKPKRDMALSALAGPVSNLVLALIIFIINNVIYTVIRKDISSFVVLEYVSFFLYYVASINISLAVFNLIPVPPLDGSRLLTAVLPSRIYYKIMRYERYFFIVILALLYLRILDIPLSFLSINIKNFLQFIADLPFRLFWCTLV